MILKYITTVFLQLHHNSICHWFHLINSVEEQAFSSLCWLLHFTWRVQKYLRNSQKIEFPMQYLRNRNKSDLQSILRVLPISLLLWSLFQMKRWPIFQVIVLVLTTSRDTFGRGIFSMKSVGILRNLVGKKHSNPIIHFCRTYQEQRLHHQKKGRQTSQFSQISSTSEKLLRADVKDTDCYMWVQVTCTKFRQSGDIGECFERQFQIRSLCFKLYYLSYIITHQTIHTLSSSSIITATYCDKNNSAVYYF